MDDETNRWERIRYTVQRKSIIVYEKKKEHQNLKAESSPSGYCMFTFPTVTVVN